MKGELSTARNKKQYQDSRVRDCFEYDDADSQQSVSIDVCAIVFVSVIISINVSVLVSLCQCKCQFTYAFLIAATSFRCNKVKIPFFSLAQG